MRGSTCLRPVPTPPASPRSASRRHEKRGSGAAPAEHTERATLVTAGLLHACAILRGERVVCWGDNRFAQLGVDAGEDCCPEATEVEGLPEGPVSDLSAGAFHTCAIVDRVPW